MHLIIIKIGSNSRQSYSKCHQHPNMSADIIFIFPVFVRVFRFAVHKAPQCMFHVLFQPTFIWHFVSCWVTFGDISTHFHLLTPFILGCVNRIQKDKNDIVQACQPHNELSRGGPAVCAKFYGKLSWLAKSQHHSRVRCASKPAEIIPWTSRQNSMTNFTFSAEPCSWM